MSESGISQTGKPIDAVILWVDGIDTKLALKRDRYRELENKKASHPGSLPLRFASSGEIIYCVRSILKFAGFIRNIYIVTDEQDPDLYDMVKTRFPGREGCIRIVDHREIFRDYEQYLPTFNSSTIHTMIWRIEGLSDRFVYFNDDVVLVREHSEKDWFEGDSPVLTGKWQLPPYGRITGSRLKVLYNRHIKGNKDFVPKVSFYIRQWISASFLGFRSLYYFHDHSPHPFSRETLAEYFSGNKGVLEKIISYRFRDPDQLLTSSLAYHLEILKGNRNLQRLNIGYLHPLYKEKKMARKIDRCMNDSRYKSVCIQNIDMMREGDRKKILEWLDSILA
ncbi:capsular biosynthesis protein [bacterium]|nr:capsular biosynthesis protein [bacterium]